MMYNMIEFMIYNMIFYDKPDVGNEIPRSSAMGAQTSAVVST